MKMTICCIEICHRPKEANSKLDFCNKHDKANDNIQNSFRDWKVAFGPKYRKKKYYQNLLTNQDVSSGKWVKEVVKHFLEEEVSK